MKLFANRPGISLSDKENNEKQIHDGTCKEIERRKQPFPSANGINFNA